MMHQQFDGLQTKKRVVPLNQNKILFKKHESMIDKQGSLLEGNTIRYTNGFRVKDIRFR